MTPRRTLASLHRAAAGTTLIEFISMLSVIALVVGSLFLLIGAGVKGRLIVRARVSDQERGRQALTWLADRVRQANYDPQAACPDGFVLAGNGNGFEQRLAFRATIDERMDPPRRTLVYYVQNRTLWQETLPADTVPPCVGEAARSYPDPHRVALTPPVVRAFDLSYLDGNGQPASTPAAVRSVRITLTVEAQATPGRLESQTYQTVVTVRAP
jgi:hypothetical protein